MKNIIKTLYIFVAVSLVLSGVYVFADTTSFAVSCYPTPTTSVQNEVVFWTASVLGVTPVSFSWSGSENLFGSAAVVHKAYQTTGTHTAQVSVTATNGEVKTATCNNLPVVADGGVPSVTLLATGIVGNPLANAGNNFKSGTAVTLTWIARNFDTCTGNGFNAAGAPSGSVSTGILSNTGTGSMHRQYQVTCMKGSMGRSAEVDIFIDPAPVAPAAPIAPTNVAASSACATSPSVVLSWTAVSGATSYKIFKNGSATALATVTTTSYTDTSVTAGQTVTYTVKASNTGGDSTSTTATPAPITVVGTCSGGGTTPSTPTGLTASGVCHNNAPAILLSWNSAGAGLTYNIYRDSATTATYSGIASLSFRDNGGVAAGSQHSYKIISSNGTQVSGFSTQVSATAPTNCGTTTPVNPTVDLKVNGSDGPITIPRGTTVTLSWTSTNANSCFSSGGNSGWGGRAKATSGSEVTVPITADSVEYTMICSNSTGNGNDTVRIYTTSVIQQPPTPTGLTATGACHQNAPSILVSWNNMGSGLTYKIYKDGATVATFTSITGTSFRDTNVALGSTHTYKVVSSNGTQVSGFSTQVSATAPSTCVSAPSAPTSVAASSVCGTTPKVTVSWNSVSGATSYKIFKNGSATALATVTGTSYVDTAVIVGNTPTYSVKAVNAGGNSLSSTSVTSNTVQGTCNTTTCVTPRPSTDLSGQFTGTSSARLTNRSTVCSYQVGLASYKMVEHSNRNQTLFDSATTTIGPNQTITLTVAIPACAYQIDAFHGPVIPSGTINYGSRLIIGQMRDAGGNYCNQVTPPATSVTLTATCAANPASILVGSSTLWTATVGGNATATKSYLWTGDEGLFGTSSTLSKIYSATGTKHASVTVTAGNLATSTQCTMLVRTATTTATTTPGTSTNNLQVSCAANPATGNLPLNVTYTATVASGTSPFIFTWSGDEGLSGTSSTTTITYSVSGTKNATVLVRDNANATSSAICSSSVTSTSNGGGGGGGGGGGSSVATPPSSVATPGSGGTSVTVAQVPVQTQVAGVYLAQVPYTGLKENALIAIILMSIIGGTTYVVFAYRKHRQLAYEIAMTPSVVVVDHAAMLSGHLEQYARTKQASISADALATIVKAAQGSRQWAEAVINNVAHQSNTNEWKLITIEDVKKIYPNI